MKKSISILILFCYCFYTHAQSIGQWEKYGDKSFEWKDFYGASKYYKEAYLLDTLNLLIMNKYAASLRLFNDYAKAEKIYQNLLLLDKQKQFKETTFWLATMQKNNAKYQIARKNFQKATQIFKDKNSYFYKKSIQEILSCEYAQILMHDTLDVKINNIGTPINTVNSDFAAWQISEKKMIFSSLRQEETVIEQNNKQSEFKVQIYEASMEDMRLKLPDSLKLLISNHEANVANGTLDAQQSIMYFTLCNQMQPCEIWALDMKKKDSKAYLLPEPINLPKYTTTQAHFVQWDSKKYLFFASDRAGGEGKFDIWCSEIVDNQFKKPFNLGKKINSLDDELCPFFNPQDTSLYFSSNWHEGLGGFDIFKSKIILSKNISLSKPTNLGYPINSAANDLYFTKNPNSSISLFSSNRVGAITSKSPTCCNDIWYFSNTTIKNKDTIIALLDNDSAKTIQQPLLEVPQMDELFSPLFANNTKERYFEKPIYLFFDNDIPNPKSWEISTQVNYLDSYLAYQNAEIKYLAIDSVNNSFLNKNQIQAFFKTDVKEGFDRLNLLIDQSIDLLKKGYSVEWEIKGTASPLANHEYNERLSKRRISSLKNYLNTYSNEILKPYVAYKKMKNKLILKELPVGEREVKDNVSDSYHNTISSVYSIEAAMERRIEIIGIKVKIH